MRIAVASKVVLDDQDIIAANDGTLDFSKAKPVVSTYDLNAIEAAAQTGADVLAISVGPQFIDDSKTKKNILARGVSELYMTADDSLADADAKVTAAQLAKLVMKAGDIDVVLCGDGSADIYAQQVDVQLACKLGWPCVNAVAKIELSDGCAKVERILEDVVETVEIPLPAVIAVMPDIANPRIPSMKDILAAGKKPSSVGVAGAPVETAIESIAVSAPEQVDRKLDVREASDEAIDAFVAVLKAAI